MTWGNTLLRLASPLVMAAFVACGGDSTGPEEDMLTLEESEALLRAVEQIGSMQPEADPASLTVDITAACSGGGEATSTGTLLPSGTEQMSSIAMDLTLVPRNCVETVEGRTFTLNGAPSLRRTGTLSLSTPGDLTLLFELDLASFGTLAYELEGRSGTCDISVRSVSQLDVGALMQTGRASGDICGNAVDVDLSGPIIPEG